MEKSRVIPRVQTTPELVKQSNEALYHAKLNLPLAAQHCGMTEKEMKHTFYEYLKYHPVLDEFNTRESN